MLVQALIWVNSMGPLDIANHLLNCVAPAAAVALVLCHGAAHGLDESYVDEAFRIF